MKDLGSLCRLIGDEARLRLLRILTLDRLNVKELTSVLGLAQSGVSRHLGLLRDAGLVDEFREGGFAYYAAAAPDGDGLRASVWGLLREAFVTHADDPVLEADRARLLEIQRLRKESFTTHGASTGQLVPGRSWAAWGRALGLLLPPMTVADVGCGEGYLTIEAARWAREVIAIDRSPDVLARARALAARRKVHNVRWEVGEIERIPLADASVDLVLLSQALHHAKQPARALAEARRVLVEGGRVLILDLRSHTQHWVQEHLGDRWLGFDGAALDAMLASAGFRSVTVTTGARLKGDPFTVLIAAGTKENGS